MWSANVDFSKTATKALLPATRSYEINVDGLNSAGNNPNPGVTTKRWACPVIEFGGLFFRLDVGYCCSQVDDDFWKTFRVAAKLIDFWKNEHLDVDENANTFGRFDFKWIDSKKKIISCYFFENKFKYLSFFLKNKKVTRSTSESQKTSFKPNMF